MSLTQGHPTTRAVRDLCVASLTDCQDINVGRMARLRNRDSLLHRHDATLTAPLGGACLKYQTLENTGDRVVTFNGRLHAEEAPREQG